MQNGEFPGRFFHRENSLTMFLRSRVSGCKKDRERVRDTPFLFLRSTKQRDTAASAAVLSIGIMTDALLRRIRKNCRFLLCTDSLSTNFLLMKADRYHCSTDRAFYFNNAFNLFRICVKQSFIFTTWTSHMHFLHNFAS